jgi:putative flavoprotein involved in K+ transport
MYARVMEVNYWSATLCTGARYDDEKGEWEVTMLWGDHADAKPIVLRPKHLVLATGMSGYPNVPAFPGAEAFEGRIVHSSQHDGGEVWRGKQCVVIGSGNSAHDICADLWEHGAASVTMVQRASTVVARSRTLVDMVWSKLYSEEALEAGITTEIADLTLASIPHKLLPELQKPIYQEIAKRDAELYAGLSKIGFLQDFGEDGAGLHCTYLRRGAGYYIDTGACEMLIDGRIKLKSPATVERVNPHSVTFNDGSEALADLIVCATGYGSMTEWAAKLISPEVAQKVGPCWGLGSGTRHDPGPWEGELRNMWKPTAQAGLWFQGGNLMQARHYSLYLALQLKARMEGLPMRVWTSRK